MSQEVIVRHRLEVGRQNGYVLLYRKQAGVR